MKTITVKHEVSPGRESCEFGGDFWGKEVCKYHTFRTQTHGRKAPPEYRKPKCLLFDCWLEQPYKKCEACKKACMEAEYDNGTTAFHGIIKTDEPRTLDFSGVRGFLVTNVCIVQRSAA